jgi:hypothetical protein
VCQLLALVISVFRPKIDRGAGSSHSGRFWLKIGETLRLIRTVCELIDDIFGKLVKIRGVGLLHLVDISFWRKLIEFRLIVDVVCRSKYCREKLLGYLYIPGREGEKGLKNQRGDAIDGVPHMG